MSTLEHGRLNTFPVTRLKGIRWWQNFNSGGSSGAKCAGFCSLEKNRANASAIVATCEIPSCEECAMCSDVDMACPHSCDTQAQCNYRGTGDSSECSKCDYCTGCPFWCDEVGECPGADEHPRWASQGDERCANCLMWSTYGVFAARDIFVWGPNGTGLVLGLMQLALKLLYPSKEDGAASE